MKWLRKLTKPAPSGETDGIRFDRSRLHWEVSCPHNLPDFFRALTGLFPEDSMLYLEGGTPSPGVKTRLDELSVPERARVDLGTSKAGAGMFHMPATEENYEILAGMAEQCVYTEMALHIVAYKDGKVLLQWYDVFDNFIDIGVEITEEQVVEFSGKLGVKHRLVG